MEKLTKEQAEELIKRIETSQSASFALKAALKEALDRDPIDAWKDASVLFRILEARIRY